MRILAIRGAGLASLAAPFDVDLSHGPLARAGVFAIVGPTGAGKSTLLDAMFLALFGETPRLSSQPRVTAKPPKSPNRTEPDQRESGPAADDAFSARDARSLARSDVSHAYAEVDFEGLDGLAYRARWDLRRKRRRASTETELDLPWRKAEHALMRLSPRTPGTDAGTEGQRLGGTKTEVLGHVVARLGLDFDQFRRAVVLAQGEIAAFLHAQDRDRAELLERMTGTEIYGELSREVHLETMRQRDHALLLEAQLAAIGLLPDALRQAAERARTESRIDVLEAERSRRQLEASLAQTRTALLYAEEHAQADDEVKRLEAQLGLAETKREEIELHQRLAAARPLLRAHERAAREEHAESEALEALRAQRLAATATHRAAVDDHARATALLPDLEAALRVTVSERDAAAAEREAARPLEALALRHRDRHEALARALEETRDQRSARARDADAARTSLTKWAERLALAPGLERVLARALGSAGDGATSAAENPGDPIQDSAAQDSAAQDSAAQDSAAQDSAAQDSAAQDSAAQDSAAQDLAARAAHLGQRLERLGEQLDRSAHREPELRERAERARERLLSGRETESAVKARAQRAMHRLESELEEAERLLESTRPDGGGPHTRTRRGDARNGDARERDPRDRDARPHRDVSASPQRSSQEGRGSKSRFLGRLISQGEVGPREGGERAFGGTRRDEPTSSAQVLGELASPVLSARPTDTPPASTITDRATLMARTARVRGALTQARDATRDALDGAREREASEGRRRREDGRARQELTRFGEELGRTDAELERAIDLAAAAERALHAAVRSAHARELRDHLVEGHPCEVCGATEHPSADGASSPDEARTKDETPDDEQAGLRRAQLACDEARAVADGLRARRLALAGAYSLLSENLSSGPSGEVPASDDVPRLSQLLERLESTRSALELKSGELLDAVARSTEAQAAVLAAERAAASAATELEANERESERARRELGALEEERAGLGLDVLLAAARRAEGAGVDLVGFIRRVRHEWSEARLAAAHLPLLVREEQVVAERESALALELAQQAEARRACEEAARTFHALSIRHEVAEAREAETRRRLDEARAAVALAERKLAAASHAMTSHQARLDDACRAHEAAKERTASFDRDLRGLLEALRIASIDEARRLGARDDEEVASLRRELDHLDATRRDAEAVRAERARRLSAHLAESALSVSSNLPEDVAALARAAATAQGREEALRSALSLAEETLRLDDRARADRADKQRELDQVRAELSVWEDLLEAYGSADGKKLRVYAQRLTLRALVREASEHLAALAPRYAIEAGSFGDLSIEVSDRALSGEARAIGALSGGETFLVSLALALALRSMASDRVRIGTLFIDEGFGSLDASSLDVVLSALDALEATGRQVGIVSHVPEVKERFAARIEVVPEGLSGGPSAGTSKSVVRVAV